MNKGFIYKLISPSNKEYIGQVTEYLRSGEKKGIRGRWLQHCRNAKFKNLKENVKKIIIKNYLNTFIIEKVMVVNIKDM